MGVIVCLIGIMVLCGWVLDITVFKSLLSNYIPMKPVSACCFILIGITLLLQHSPNAKWKLITGKILSGIIILIGLMTSFEFFSGINFHVNAWVMDAISTSMPLDGRPAQWAILNFILIGVSLLLIDIPFTIYFNQLLAFAVGLIGLLILTGYIFSFHSEVTIQTYSHASIYTAICFILISLSLLFLRPTKGFMPLFISKTDGGIIARTLIPIVIIVPIILGYLRILGQHYSIYAPNSGLEFYSILITATLIMITIFISDILLKSNQKRLEVESKLHMSYTELNDLYNHAPCGYHSLNADGTIIRMNQTELDWLGYQEEEVVGKMKITEMLTPLAQRDFEKRFGEFKEQGYIRDIEVGYVRKNKSIFTVLLNATAVTDDDGKFLMTRSTVFDISERKRIEQELRLSEERFYSAMDTAPIGMAIVALDGSYVEVNQALCQLLGYNKEELLDMNFQKITHPDDLHIDIANSQKLIEGKIRLNQIEKRYLRKNGEIIWVQLTASILRDANTNDPLYFIAQVEDITDRKLVEERIRHLAYHDSLTNLPNRRLLLDRLTLAMDFAKRHQNVMALMFLDLDRFKYINDTLGHDVGDELLKAVAVRLNTALRSVDTIARISGDEFVIILNELSSPNEASLIAAKIIEMMNVRFLVHGHELNVSCSIGITLYPKDGLEISDLMKKADLAMYTAKESGRNQYRFYH